MGSPNFGHIDYLAGNDLHVRCLRISDPVLLGPSKLQAQHQRVKSEHELIEVHDRPRAQLDREASAHSQHPVRSLRIFHEQQSLQLAAARPCCGGCGKSSHFLILVGPNASKS